LNRRALLAVAAGLMLGSVAVGQNPPANKPQAPAVQPANELADALAQRLSSELHVKTAVGEPVKVGTVTLIPIMMIDVSFGVEEWLVRALRRLRRRPARPRGSMGST